jgi:hypothetical protein
MRILTDINHHIVGCRRYGQAAYPKGFPQKEGTAYACAYGLASPLFEDFLPQAQMPLGQ